MANDLISRRAVLGGMAAVAGGLLLRGAPALAAGEYPSKNLTMIVPFGAGGGSDLIARTIVSVIQELNLLPVQLLVENRPGSSGAKGYKLVADHKGDPYYIATVSVSFFTTPLLGASPVSLKDFTPIAALAMSPYILVVRKDSKIQSIDDLKNAKQLSTGTTGVVSDAALMSKMLQDEVGVKVTVVPFDGEGEIKSGLLGGHLDIMWGNPGEILPQIDGGLVRPIAVTTPNRLKSLPDVPTFKEAGFNIEHTQLRGIVMPQDMPADVTKYWEGILQKVASSDQWQKQYLDRYKDEPLFLGTEEFKVKMTETNERYARLMKELKIIK